MTQDMAQDLGEAAEETRAWADELIRRQPGLREPIEAKLAEAAAEVFEMFQPYLDLDAGTITMDEFTAIMAERRALDEERRAAKWQLLDEEEDLWEARCGDCQMTCEVEGLPDLYYQCDKCREREDAGDQEEDGCD